MEAPNLKDPEIFATEAGMSDSLEIFSTAAMSVLADNDNATPGQAELLSDPTPISEVTATKTGILQEIFNLMASFGEDVMRQQEQYAQTQIQESIRMEEEHKALEETNPGLWEKIKFYLRWTENKTASLNTYNNLPGSNLNT